jgi:hypothetical protein
MRRLVAVIACCAALTACGSDLSVAVPRNPIKFSSVQNGRSVTVVETRVPTRITFEQFARNEPKMLTRALGARHVELWATNVGRRRALRVTYQLPHKGVTQYFVRNGELMYVVTYTHKRG